MSTTEHATLSEFRIACPEFAQVTDPTIQQYLADKAAEIDPAVWGASTRRAHILLTADAIAMSPFGRQLRNVVSAKGLTPYIEEFKNLRGVVPAVAVL